MEYYFELGYYNARDGIKVENIPAILVITAEKSAWLSGWYAYHSGTTLLNDGDTDDTDVYLSWH